MADRVTSKGLAQALGGHRRVLVGVGICTIVLLAIMVDFEAGRFVRWLAVVGAASLLIWAFYRIDRWQTQWLLKQMGRHGESKSPSDPPQEGPLEAFDSLLGAVTKLLLCGFALALAIVAGLHTAAFLSLGFETGLLGTIAGAFPGAYIVLWAFHKLSRSQTKRLLRENGIEWMLSTRRRRVYKVLDTLAAVAGIVILIVMLRLFGGLLFRSGR